MRLCKDCTYYEEISSIARCRKYHWISNNEQKPKIYNPMMFDCLDYDPKEPKRGFVDDLDVFMSMSR